MSTKDALEKLTLEISDNGYFKWDNFLPANHLNEIIRTAHERESHGFFKDAGIGKQELFQVDKSIRGDKVKWINISDKNRSLQFYLHQIQIIIDYINETCFIGLKDFELHYAIYPENTFYKRHKDRFTKNAHRIISFILYLNPEWKKGHGGELALYLGDRTEIVEPIANRLLLFRSEIEHEVLLSHPKRASITGWMLDKDMSLTFLP